MTSTLISPDVVPNDVKPTEAELIEGTPISELDRCYYVENALFLSLFGLLFWDIIFTSVPGAFYNHYQRGPRHLFSNEFYSLRKELIDARLSLLLDDDNHHAWRDLIQTHFHVKYGLANQLVHWGLFEDSDLLEVALARIPASHLHALFKRICQHPGHYRNGFPDLIYFPANGSYELVEVKGPGDRLQKNQKRWLRFFKENDIPAQVAYVTWQKDAAT